MELKLVRDIFNEDCTMGKLYIDGKFECYTLEDVARTGPKVYGATCIPEGSYKVVLTMSPRFKKIMPRLLEVPGFDGILIHVGNTAKDTDGCILVGQAATKNALLKSQIAWDQLNEKLAAVKEPITIEVTR